MKDQGIAFNAPGLEKETGDQFFNEDKFVKFKIKTHSDEWFKFRTVGIDAYPGGIGGSEVGKILGTDPYAPVQQELFYHKVGTESPEKFDNPAMFHGRKLEDYVRRIWQCYDGTEDGYVAIWENWEKNGFRNEDLVRVSHPIGCYLVNVDHPYFFTSLDYIMDPGAANLLTGEAIGKPSPLEIKTIQHWAAAQWEQDLPPKYLDQLFQQMIVTEADYGEIAVLEDGRQFRVYTVEKDLERCELIQDRCKKFWFGRVLPARKLLKEYEKGTTREREQIMMEISNLEPPPDGNPAYRDYISRKHLTVKQFTYGEPAHFLHAQKLRKLTEIGKYIEEVKVKLKNQWYEYFTREGLEEMRFGTGNGKISAKKNSNGALNLYNSAKTDYKIDLIEAKKFLNEQILNK